MPLAAIISANDLGRLCRFEAEWGRDLATLEASQAALDDVTEVELEARIAKAIKEVRAEVRGSAGKRPKPM